jgi:hypothetical protein
LSARRSARSSVSALLRRARPWHPGAAPRRGRTRPGRRHPEGSYLRASLCLVADHRDHGIVGTLLAYPPINAVGDIINATDGMLTRQQAFTLGLVGAVALTKIKAVAVAEPARRQHIGGSLLKRGKQIYLHLGYKLVYGQMPANPDPETFLGNHHRALALGPLGRRGSTAITARQLGIRHPVAPRA